MSNFVCNRVTYYSDFTFSEPECHYNLMILTSDCMTWFKNFTRSYKEEFGDSFYTAWVADDTMRVYAGLDTFFTITFNVERETASEQ